MNKLQVITAQDLLREGFDASLRASARGYNTEGDVLTQTIDGRDLNEVWQEFQQALAAWNAGRTALVNALTFSVQAPNSDASSKSSVTS